MLYAQVIVDIKTAQTNQAYTYRVPAALAATIKCGMRVIVGFGRRKLQGFVWQLSEVLPASAMQYAKHIKDIDSVLDFTPVINEEGLQLAGWLAQNNLAFLISCLQVQLPAALKANYQKTITVSKHAQISPKLAAYLDKANTINVTKMPADKAIIAELSQLRRQKLAQIDYQISDNAHAKTANFIKANRSASALKKLATTLPARSSAQIRLVQYLAAHPSKWLLQSQVLHETKISASTITTAKQHGWLIQDKRVIWRNPFLATDVKKSVAQPLTSAQKKVLAPIVTAIDERIATPFLLEGITGSGKTEVYFQAIAHALAQGKTALLLVPEISLTPQMVKRVKSRFNKLVAVWHSQLSVGEKYDEWRRIKKGAARVVIGVRSAVFAPLKNLGVIILDEEHEASYKEHDMPRYHARDVAKWRSQFHHCPLVMGSATPSLESRARAAKNVYHLLRLDERINQKPLPKVEIIDLKTTVPDPLTRDLTPELITALKACKKAGHQAVLLLNRRGYANFMMCRVCGQVIECPNCDISLTQHQFDHTLKCHYCGFSMAIPQTCPHCRSNKLQGLGSGTQRLFEELEQVMPDANVVRIDNDTTQKKGSLAQMLADFGAGKYDIMLGTQMIAKGLDYPNVTLVGVVLADTGLAVPDFRASERTFQLLVQVAGRAGRGNDLGKVIIQTFNPQHYAIKLAQTQDYERFFNVEMKIRHATNYPPYYYTLQLTTSAKNDMAARRAIGKIKAGLVKYLSKQAIVLGPTPQALTRLKQRYYYQIIIKYKFEPQLMAYLQKLIENAQKQSKYGVAVTIDKDPQSFI